MLLWRSEPHADPLFAEEVLLPLAEEAFRLVEAHEGAQFRRRPSVRAVATIEEWSQLQRKELLAWHQEVSPDADEEEVLEAVERTIREFPTWAVAEYSSASHTITLFKDRIRDRLSLMSYLEEVKPAVLKQILVHEVVHALDEDLYGAVSDRACLCGEDFEVRTAVVEGHAEYVTGVIAHQTDEWSIFEAWQSSYAGVEDALAFRHYHGRQFFERLAERGQPDFVAQVFRSPPTSREQIMDPMLYSFGD